MAISLWGTCPPLGGQAAATSGSTKRPGEGQAAEAFEDGRGDSRHGGPERSEGLAWEADSASSADPAGDFSKDLRQAAAHYAWSVRLCRKVGYRRGEATSLNNLGSVQSRLGEKQKALESFDQALRLYRGLRDVGGEAAALNNLGSLYHEFGQDSKALDYYNEALELERTAKDRRAQSYTLGNIGMVYLNFGEKQSALDRFREALRLARSLANPRSEAFTLQRIGSVYGSWGQKQKALDYYRQALSIARDVGDLRGQAYVLASMGRAYGDLGDHAKAMACLLRAQTLSQKVGDRSLETSVLFESAKVERDRHRLAEALTKIEAVLSNVESLRTNVSSQELRASYLASVHRYYEFAIELLMAMHRREPEAGYDRAALESSERSRARSLLELLSEARVDIREGVGPALLEREHSIQRQLNAQAQERMRLLSGRHSSQQAAALSKTVERLSTEYEQVKAEIRAASPRYAALTQPQPLSVVEIQKSVLDPDSLLLEYSLGRERSFLWAVTPSSVASFELPKRSEIEEAARCLYALLIARGSQEGNGLNAQRAGGDPTEETRWASALSEMLLAPVAPLLEGKRLLIVAEGALQSVPFSCLPRPRFPADGREASEPVLAQHEIVSVPSASALAVLRRESAARQPAEKAVAVLADPVFDREDERVRRTRSGAAPAAGETALPSQVARMARDVGVLGPDGRMARLPFTRLEAEGILASVPDGEGFRALDFQANRETATGEELRRYRFVHFATHALIDSEHPELSGVVLSLVYEDGAPRDGFLRLHDIYNLRLPAELVVLSACQTGLGKEIQGEGLVGLTRGFLYAGASRVVATLWKVDDEASAELMRRFYRGMLGEGMRPAAALRQAQRDLSREKRWAHPYYWAPFLLQGEWK